MGLGVASTLNVIPTNPYPSVTPVLSLLLALPQCDHVIPHLVPIAAYLEVNVNKDIPQTVARGAHPEPLSCCPSIHPSGSLT